MNISQQENPSEKEFYTLSEAACVLKLSEEQLAHFIFRMTNGEQLSVYFQSGGWFCKEPTKGGNLYGVNEILGQLRPQVRLPQEQILALVPKVDQLFKIAEDPEHPQHSLAVHVLSYSNAHPLQEKFAGVVRCGIIAVVTGIAASSFAAKALYEEHIRPAPQISESSSKHSAEH